MGGDVELSGLIIFWSHSTVMIRSNSLDCKSLYQKMHSGTGVVRDSINSTMVRLELRHRHELFDVVAAILGLLLKFW